jgi:hypothetical protein|nr:hypothetical protein [Clostridia bacterium]
MAKNVSSKQGLFDDLDFAQSSGLPKRDNVENQTAGSSKAEKDIWDEWKSKMTVKKSVYLTKRTAEALALRHAGMAKTDRDFSKTVNAALESYLEEEIEALEEAGIQHIGDEMARYSQALSVLMTKRLEK